MSIESLCIRGSSTDPVSDTTRKIQFRALECEKKHDFDGSTSSLAHQVVDTFDDDTINAFFDFATLLCGMNISFETVSNKSDFWNNMGNPLTFKHLCSLLKEV